MGEKRILLVEDNEDNRTIYSTILTHRGYDVIEAPNGLEGVLKAESHHPDLIIMDLSLPVMDGIEATRRIRLNPRTSDIPVLAVTAHALESDRDNAMRAGCNDYLAKPVEPRRLADQVESIIGPAAEYVS